MERVGASDRRGAGGGGGGGGGGGSGGDGDGGSARPGCVLAVYGRLSPLAEPSSAAASAAVSVPAHGELLLLLLECGNMAERDALAGGIDLLRGKGD